MNWLVELLLTLITWSFRDDTRSVVGKSRIDEESDRLWKWIAVAVIIAATIAWLVFRR
ncbi:MAG: hypothetical protein WCF18_05025 [Chthoniobacteraceae bacterium]